MSEYQDGWHCCNGWELSSSSSPRCLVLNLHVLETEGAGTRVTLTGRQKLRGLSRVGGGFMLKRATRKQLDEALDALAGLV